MAWKRNPRGMTNVWGFVLDRKKSLPCPQLRATGGITQSQFMANKDANERLGNRIGSKAGCFPLGSAQSRAAWRSLLAAGKAGEDGIRFRRCSIINGEPVNFDGLAERLRGAWKKAGRIWELKF